MKRLLTLSTFLLLSIMTFAQTEVDGIYYTFSGTEATVVSGTNEYTGSITIPTSVSSGGKTYSVTSLGERAFKSCSGLTSVTIPNSVTSIGSKAFLYCSKLTSITIPNSVTSIGDEAFRSCSGLTSVTIGNSVTSIGSKAFLYCSKLTSVAIGNSVTSIGNGAFYGCSGLTSITIPSSVTSIGNTAFSYCDGLTSIKVQEGNTKYDSRSNCNAIIETATNTLVTGCKNTVIPNSVTSIGDYAFGYCSGLTSVTIPNNVTSIGDYAFGYCSGLTSVTIPNSVTSIGNDAFKGCSGLTSVIWNAKYCTSIPFSIISAQIKEISFGSEVEKIHASLCSGMTALTSITSEIENPFEISEFSYQTYTDATLYVPAGTKLKYKATAGWKNFTKIISGTYILTYKVDGKVYKQYELAENSAITPETAPTKTGYNFSGWSEIPATMPANDVTITGAFTINKYNLIYKVDAATYKTFQVTYGSVITPETAPAKTGYNFSGWSEIPSTMPAGDVTVTGTFTVNKYNLIYKVDGATYKTYQVAYGSTITPETAPTKTGYNFSGWSEIPATMPANDVTVTGTFTINKYNLTYKVDGATYKTYQVAYGSTITPEPAPTKTGYTFSGWSEIPKTMPANDVTVTGAFTINKYTLTYKVDGATYKSFQVTYGSVITPETAPAKTGYTFSGWKNLPSTMPAGNVTVTGTFTANKYTLTYKVDGAIYRTYQVAYGSTITPEPAPTKTWYTFSGWSEIPTTMPANNVIVTGTFTDDRYVGGIYYNYSGTEATVVSKPNMDKYTGSVTIPVSVTSGGKTYGVTSIGSSAFNGCSKLTSVTIPNSVTSIGDYAFSGCSGLTSATIPNNVTSIGSQAFSGCSGLTSVTIPNSVTSVGNSAFYNCSGLTSIKVLEGNTKYDSRNNCNAIIETATNTLVTGCKNTTIPNSVTSIGQDAFSGCSNLTSITIPNSVTSIGSYAFSNCSGLTSVTIPNNVTSIGTGTFSGCPGLTSVSIDSNDILSKTYTSSNNLSNIFGSQVKTYILGDNVKSIGEYAFSGCSGLTSVTIPNSVIRIENYAFYNCSELTSITISENMMSIGDYAFKGCSGITSIRSYIENPTEATGVYFDISNYSNATLYVPQGTKNKYLATNGWKNFANIVEMAPTPEPSSDNTLAISNAETYAGKQVVLPIDMNNVASIKAFQYDLYLPDGVTIAKDGDNEYMVELTSRAAKSHSISAQTRPDGAIRMVCTSLSGASFKGNEGTIVNVTLSVASDMTAGNYEIKIKNIELSDGTPYNPADIKATLTVKAYTPGDVDGTGTVSVNDAVCIINYILGSPIEGFIEAAADLDGNGVITVNDVVILINDYILGGNSQNSLDLAFLEDVTADDDYLFINDITMKAGETTEVEVYMNTNRNDIQGLQCDIYLPEGMEFVPEEDGDEKYYADKGGRAAKSHSVAAQLREDGSVRVVETSTSGAKFKDNDQAVFYFTVKAKEDMVAGNYEIKLANMELSYGGTPINPSDRTAKVVITDPSAINGVNAEDAKSFVGKFIKDNKIIIMKNGKKHSVSGQGM